MKRNKIKASKWIIYANWFVLDVLEIPSSFFENGSYFFWKKKFVCDVFFFGNML